MKDENKERIEELELLLKEEKVLNFRQYSEKLEEIIMSMYESRYEPDKLICLYKQVERAINETN